MIIVIDNLNRNSSIRYVVIESVNDIYEDEMLRRIKSISDIKSIRKVFTDCDVYVSDIKPSGATRYFAEIK